MRAFIAAGLAALFVSGCEGPPERERAPVQVRGAEQERLHQLTGPNRDIAMRRAIRDSGYRCQRVTQSGFVGPYENLDMWTAACDDGRQWAVFVGPD
jgi:hypothetical protein